MSAEELTHLQSRLNELDLERRDIVAKIALIQKESKALIGISSYRKLLKIGHK